jgi:hypothetical protein
MSSYVSFFTSNIIKLDLEGYCAFNEKPPERSKKRKRNLLSRTNGVSIFINYCPAAAIQRKVEGKEMGHWIDNRARSIAVQHGAICYLIACTVRGALAKPPTHTLPPPPPTGL